MSNNTTHAQVELTQALYQDWVLGWTPDVGVAAAQRTMTIRP